MPAAITARQGQHRLDDRTGSQVDGHEQAAGRVVVLEHRAQLMTAAQQSRVADRPRPRLGQLEVPHPGCGCDDDSRPGDLSAPAKVDVLPEEHHLGVETRKSPEQVGTDECAAPRHGEDLAHLVVLGLVQLTRLDALDAGAETVDADPNLQQTIRGVPLDELRADDAGVGAIGLAHHAPDGVWCRGYVVVADQEVRCPLHSKKGLVGSRGETSRFALAKDEGARQHCRDTCGQLIVARGVDHEHVEVRVVLSANSLQTFLEPPTWVTSDHHGDDRRDLLLRHQGHHATADPGCETGAGTGKLLAIVSTRATKRSIQMTDRRQELTQAAGALADFARQASYVAIGAGVIGVHKAQVRRKEMADAASRALKAGAGSRKEAARAAKDLDANVAEVISFVDSALEPVFKRLPGPAQAAVQQAREARDELRARVMGLAG